jgi:TadE-like protein
MWVIGLPAERLVFCDVPNGATARMSAGIHLRPNRRSVGNGQAMAEFAIVGGIFFLVIFAIIQFGLITLSQITRDTARWAVTQSTSPCEATSNRSGLASEANQFALQWRLIGYRAGTWTTAGPISSLSGPGIAADWPIPAVAPGGAALFVTDCPPSNNGLAWFVRVRIDHPVPIFLPGLQLIAPSCGVPGFCITSTTELRMEPKSP